MNGLRDQYIKHMSEWLQPHLQPADVADSLGLPYFGDSDLDFFESPDWLPHIERCLHVLRVFSNVKNPTLRWVEYRIYRNDLVMITELRTT